MFNPQLPRSPAESLPTMYDLPSEFPEELGLPDEFHEFQPQLLRETCQPTTDVAHKTFIGTDLNIYYNSRQPLWHKRPDWFLVLGVERAERQADLRLSYVIWQEGVAPFLVVELLSPGTEADDLGQTLREINQPPTKWEVYERILRVPYYAVFSRYDNQLRLFQLVGSKYEEVALPEQCFWFEELGLGLGVWQGTYALTRGHWLRWYGADNQWLPTPTERTEQERARAEQERARADRLAAQLKALGIEPEI